MQSDCKVYYSCNIKLLTATIYYTVYRFIINVHGIFMLFLSSEFPTLKSIRCFRKCKMIILKPVVIQIISCHKNVTNVIPTLPKCIGIFERSI